MFPGPRIHFIPNGEHQERQPAILTQFRREGDLDGDGQLEIFVQTFDHGLDVFTVPGSGANCLLWPTARGGPWRMGQQNGSWMLTDLFADGFEFGHTSRWSRTVP